MLTPFYASYVALWLVVLVQAVLLFLLYRHIGLTLLSTAEGIQRDGLGVGEIAPAIDAITTESKEVRWAPQPGRAELLVFASPDCEPCAEIFPYINRVGMAAGHVVSVTAIVAGDSGRARRAAETFGAVVPFMAEDGHDAFDRYRVRVTPFAFVIGTDGRVQAKGLCDQPNALRRLLMAGGLSEAAHAVEPEPSTELVRHNLDSTAAGRTASP